MVSPRSRTSLGDHFERFGVDVDSSNRRVGTVRGQRDRLRPDAAACLEHARTCRITGVVVQQLDERVRLIPQSFGLAGGIAVNVPLHSFRSLIA